ncbi:MAG: hypothetical protein OEY89_16945, partial [Gammaproteobacteria bacterium]|nr:hypothetical protein [Gammaproteobacteria bacterium]
EIENANEFLVTLCADDILFPTFLEEIVKAIYEEPKATLYHAKTMIIDAVSKLISTDEAIEYRQDAEGFLDSFHGSRQIVHGSGYVMHFDDFKAVGGFPAYPGMLFADVWTFYALTLMGYKVCVQQQLVGWRRHDNAEGNNVKVLKYVEASKMYLDDLLQFGYLDDQQRFSNTRDHVNRLISRINRSEAKRLIKSPIQTNIEEKTKEWQSTPLYLKKYRTYVWDLRVDTYWELVKIQSYPIRILAFLILQIIVGIRYIRSRFFEIINDYSSSFEV